MFISVCLFVITGSRSWKYTRPGGVWRRHWWLTVWRGLQKTAGNCWKEKQPEDSDEGWRKDHCEPRLEVSMSKMSDRDPDCTERSLFDIYFEIWTLTKGRSDTVMFIPVTDSYNDTNTFYDEHVTCYSYSSSSCVPLMRDKIVHNK